MKTKITLLIIMGLFLAGFIHNSAVAQDDLVDSFKENLPQLLNSNNAGTLFWITFHPCYEDSGPNNALRIYVSSAVATTVTLEIPGLAIMRQKVTIPNDVIEFPLPVAEGQAYSKGGQMSGPPLPAQVWEGRAIKISADYPIIVYGVTRFRYTSDGYLALPASSLGKKYQVASYEDPTNNTNQYFPSFTSIVGVYDNTKVTFRLGGFENARVPLLDGSELRANEVMRTTINEGDIWLIPGIGAFNDLTGSTINATKPVNVLSGSFCAYIPSFTPACDFIIEQELPENVWGKKYHVTPIQGRKKYTIIKIFAKKPMTQYFFDGLPSGTIQSAGGLRERGWMETRAGADDNPRPVVVSSKEAINVVQFNPGQNDDGIENDPFQLQLSPLQQYQTEIVFNTPGIRGGFGFKDNFINIAYKATIDGGLPQDMEIAEVIDGQFRWIPLEAFSGNPGTPFNDFDEDGRRYYSKTIRLLYDGVYKLRANDPFVAYAYGYDWYDSYGFPTSVATADLETPDTLAPYVTFMQDC
ncbi:MAG: IgGFc-binding protein, partial [Candidatus Kapabacteria bacterium]|nr:IgGFc-binding protein [Candidatus Kapabacteria bacterium]